MRSIYSLAALALAGNAIAQEWQTTAEAQVAENDSEERETQPLEQEILDILLSNRTVGQNGQEGNSSSAIVEKALTNADMGLLSDYGCWCYFEANHGAGRGKPIDELDSFCKTLHDGYECIMYDSDQAGTPCIPWEVAYNSAFGSGFPTGISLAELSSNCDNSNPPGSCAAWTCVVEGYFAQQFFLYATSGGIINNDNRHANGFEPKDNCPITKGPESDKSCCGHYPKRAPFKTYSGNRSCCNGRTYNTDMFQCCLDNSGDEDRIAIAC